MLRPLRPAPLAVAALTASLVLTPGAAWSASADLLIIVDTSASMSQPSGGADGESRLDVARRVAREVAEAAQAQGNRVGLFRFRQASTLVTAGEGEQIVVSEHAYQCMEMIDLLVPIDAAGYAGIDAWTNGVDAPGDPELEALGDSPLYGSVRVGLRFIRMMRQLEPVKHCVNAAIVVITDGNDTCAGGGELQVALAELKAQGVAEDIRAYVLAADPTTPAAGLIADIGHDDPATTEPFGFEEADALVTLVGQIEGRLAPAACVISGVPQEMMSSGENPAPEGELFEPEDTVVEDSDGCAGAPGGGPAPWVWLGALALLLALRRRSGAARLLVGACVAALAVGACSDGTTSVTSSEPDAWIPELTLPEPEDELAAALEETDAMVDAAAEAYDNYLAVHVEPAAAFAAIDVIDVIDGDAVAGCAALVDRVAFEPYQSAQRGPAGCLGTLRCNAIDQALFFQACLEHHGVASELRRCDTDEAAREALREAAGEPVDPPSIDEAVAHTQAPFEATIEGLGATSLLEQLGWASVELYQRDIDATVQADVDGLMPLLELDPAATTASVEAALEAALEHHYVVDVDPEGDAPEAWVPVLDSDAGLDCETKAFDWTDDAAQARVELLVQYAELYDNGGGNFPSPYETLELQWYPAQRWGQPARLTITDANEAPPEHGIPAAATSGCFAAQVTLGDEVTEGQPFALLSAQTDGCPEAPIVDTKNRALIRLILRTGSRLGSPNSGMPWHEHERVLIDRWGYSPDVPTALATGGQYTLTAMRSLVTMRADVRIGGGRPTVARHYSELLQHVVGSRDYYQHRLRETYGVALEQVAPARPVPPVHSSTMAWYTDRAPQWLGEGHRTFAMYPWRTVTLRRRGYGEIDAGPMGQGLGFREQMIFDVVDLADAAWGPAEDAGAAAHEARLVANVALGALVTEAERLAIGVYERTLYVVNAGDMFRHGEGVWATWGSDADHAADQFPMGVQEAAEARLDDGDQLVVSPGEVVALDDSTYVGWWRVAEETGFALGEMRYDGTFYGGGAASAIGNFAHCLAFQAIQALTCHAQVIPNVDCCKVQVLLALLFGMLPGGGEALAGLQAGGLLPAYGEPPEKSKQARDAVLKGIEVIVTAQTATGTDPAGNPLAAALTLAQTAAEAYDAAVAVKKAPPCMLYVLENETVVGGDCPEPTPE